MIVKFAAPLAAARGTIGGLVFSKNKAGPYVKQWAPPSQPRTQQQTAQRSRLAKIPGLWTALSAAQRTAWDVFADLPAQELINSLAETYTISGFAWFGKTNIRLLKIGRATTTATPVIARPSAPTINDFLILQSGAAVNHAAGATATASSENPPTGAKENMFDENFSSVWTTLGDNVGWITALLPAGPTIITVYQLTASNVGFNNRMCKDWTFEGWNGSSWDILDTVTGETGWDIREQRSFVVSDPNLFAQYRLNVSAQNTAVVTMFINELEMFASEQGASIIVYPTGDFADHDLVLFISQAASPNRQVFHSGFLSIIQTQDPGTNHIHFEDELAEVFGLVQNGRSWGAQLFRQTSEGLRSAPATAVTVS